MWAYRMAACRKMTEFWYWPVIVTERLEAAWKNSSILGDVHT